MNLRNFSCVIVKPDGYPYKERIIYEIEKELKLEIKVKDENYVISRKRAELWYIKYKSNPNFNEIVEAVCGKPMCRMFVEGKNALEKILERAGKFTDPKDSREKEPYSWRGRWGTKLPYNVVHRPVNEQELVRDVRIHFSLKELENVLEDEVILYLFGI